MVYKYRVTDGRAQEGHYGLTLAKMMHLPPNILERAGKVSQKLRSMVESWRHASKSSEIIQYRRRLAEISHRLVHVSQNMAELEPNVIVGVLREIQAKSVLDLMDQHHFASTP
ncbi:MutS protein msh4 [Actinomortierella ambigua]|uniref:MutS protein msh4 n=1 Tax=Actinomortierella ambigua TaxID=1343610 RepID=A0A9P6QIQ2_9FUNG|nr:MutS protein msh4 [Actinomortierella ambigua]